MIFQKISNMLKVRLIGVFVALSLSVTYYYIVKPWAMGVPGNSTNLWVFSAMSKANYHAETLGVWRPRVAGLWLAGQMFDDIVKDGEINVQDYQSQKIVVIGVRSQENQKVFGRYINVQDYQNVFGLYHACWLFIFFLMLLFLVERPVFMILGCFAGIFYMYSPLANYYFYPWDFPSLTAFTLSCLLWQRKNYNLMLAVIFVGYGFKETVAVTALLYFFTSLPIWKRVAYFLAAAVSTSLLKLVIMQIVYGTIKMVTQDIILSDGRVLLFVNIARLYTPQWNHVMFVNAGTLVLALLLPARNRTDWGLKAVLLAFFAGQMVSGSISEYRVWLEALPLSMICLRDYLQRIETTPSPIMETKKGAEGRSRQK
jgi:hypothetical protein